MVLVARSIAEVTSEINWADIRGTVQTVFPPRACSAPTLEESATQDVGDIYHDSYHPLEDVEGYRKVSFHDHAEPSGAIGSLRLPRRLIGRPLTTDPLNIATFV